jgi:hypothetical protein
MRAMIVLAGVLIAMPALASDGTYRGSSEVIRVISGIGCQTDTWEFRVTGSHVKAARISTGLRGGLAAVTRMEGEIQPDGAIQMSASTPAAEIPLNVGLTGKFTNGSFDGITRTDLCEYRTTAVKTSR